jgi:uncharacterized protein (DUF433 family)
LQVDEPNNRITIDQDILSGQPVIRGTRIPVYLIIELLGCGMSETEIVAQYPSLTKDDIKAALLYASKCVENEDVILT